MHFPIAFLILSYSLTLLHYVATSTSPLVPTASYPLRLVTPHLPTLSATAHLLLTLGILSGLVSIVTGGVELSRLIAHGGQYEADGTTTRPKIKVAFAHALVNDLVVAGAAVGWWFGGAEKDAGMEGVGGGGPSGWTALLAAGSVPALVFSASLGGALVYNYGVGLRMGTRKGKAA